MAAHKDVLPHWHMDERARKMAAAWSGVWTYEGFRITPGVSRKC